MSDQFEFHCPQCRRRTVVPADQSAEEIIYCPKCEVAMVKKAQTSQVAEASANAPSMSSNQVATATVTATGKKATKTKSTTTKTRATKTKAAGTRSSRATAVATPAVAIIIPEFGNFRCPCCGIAKTFVPGEVKTGTPYRCTTCFVKLDFLK